MVVLDPSQVPNEPGDRVSFAVEAKRKLLGRQVLNHAMNDALDPAESIHKKVCRTHGTSFYYEQPDLRGDPWN
jgi:hypothetical protein